MSKARQLADLGNVYDDGALSNRNLIINGAMQVAQRGTSFTGPTNDYTLDRFVCYQTSGFLDVAQDSDAPNGFRNSLKTTVNTANASPASTDLARIAYVVEAQDVSRLNYGSASAQTLTLSFWVKSTVAADYTIFVYVDDPARSIVKGYTINSANTWEHKTITISGDTGGTGINDDNGVGIYYEFNLMAGSTYSTAGAQDVWVSGGGTRASGQTANCTTSGATWQITGVQLEVGDLSTATPFEHRPYSDELQRCFRYYEQWDCVDGENIHLGTSYNGQPVTAIKYVVRKRASPTITLPTAGQTSGTISFLNGTGGYPTTTGTHSTSQVNNRGARIASSGYSGITSAQPAMLYTNGSTIFKFDAEL